MPLKQAGHVHRLPEATMTTLWEAAMSYLLAVLLLIMLVVAILGLACYAYYRQADPGWEE
jgi:putative exporter of polyketide antibiotics